jgi:hypothetical protein
MRDSRSRGASCAGRGSSTISTGPASFASSHARKTSATTETVKTMRILGAVYSRCSEGRKRLEIPLVAASNFNRERDKPP